MSADDLDSDISMAGVAKDIHQKGRIICFSSGQFYQLTIRESWWHLVFVRMSSCADIIFDSISTHLYGPSILHRPFSMKDLLYEVQLYLELLFRYIFSLFMA